MLHSDNGSNFVGAQKEQEKAYSEMDYQKIQLFLKNIGTDHINSHRNTPASSHMGGIWERQIQSAQTILMPLLHTSKISLNDKSLRTLLAETEAIITSRPLMVDTLRDIQSKQPICTSIMKPKVLLPPPGHFVKAGENSRKRWRHIQHIANEL